MKAPLIIIAVSVALLACGKSNQPEPMQSITMAQADDARRATVALLGEKGRVLYICGQSDGVGIYVDAIEKDFQPDGMKDGRLVFLTRLNDTPDLFFRDATGTFTSAIDDGGEVRRILVDGGESWVVVYPSTGVTETHNLTGTLDGKLIDLWTSNKPPVLIGANAKLFRAECVRA